MRRIIYVLLLALAPGFVFLIQAVLFLPPALIFSGVPSVIWLQLSSGNVGSVALVAFFLGHFLLLAGLYWLIAFALGRLVVFFRQPRISRIVFGLVLVGIIAVSQLSIFGSGGHGPSELGPLQTLFFESSYLPGNSLFLYLASVAFFALIAVVLSIVTLRRR